MKSETLEFFRMEHDLLPPLLSDQQSISVLYSLSYQFHYYWSHTLRLLSMIAAMGVSFSFTIYCCCINHNFDVVLLFWSFFLSCMLMEGNRKWHVRFEFHSVVFFLHIWQWRLMERSKWNFVKYAICSRSEFQRNIIAAII